MAVWYAREVYLSPHPSTLRLPSQMAKLKGYKVIGTCPEGKADVGLATGCDELIVLKVRHRNSRVTAA